MKARYPVAGAGILFAVVMLNLGCPALAEEMGVNVSGSLGSSTISGYVDTSAVWTPGSGPTAVPEPSVVALAVLGGGLLVAGRWWSRR